MQRIGKNRGDDQFLKKLGLRISHEIRQCGYKSAYQFWIEKADGQFSRTTLTYILSGRMDAKITTLRVIARLLKTDVSAFFDFTEKESDNNKLNKK